VAQAEPRLPGDLKAMIRDRAEKAEPCRDGSCRSSSDLSKPTRKQGLSSQPIDERLFGQGIDSMTLRAGAKVPHLSVQ
jgi:hypothetical protein